MSSVKKRKKSQKQAQYVSNDELYKQVYGKEESSMSGCLHITALIVLSILTIGAAIVGSIALYRTFHNVPGGGGGGEDEYVFPDTFTDTITFDGETYINGPLYVLGKLVNGEDDGDDDTGGSGDDDTGGISTCLSETEPCKCTTDNDADDRCEQGQRWCYAGQESTLFGLDFACRLHILDQNEEETSHSAWIGTNVQQLHGESTGPCMFNDTVTSASSGCAVKFGANVDASFGFSGIYIPTDILITAVSYTDGGYADMNCNNNMPDETYGIDVYDYQNTGSVSRISILTENKVSSRMYQENVNVFIPAHSTISLHMRNNCGSSMAYNFIINMWYRIIQPAVTN